MAVMVLFGCFYWLFIFVKRAGKLKNAKEGSAMSNEDEFFAEMHPQIAQVIGIAVMQLLVEKREPSREALIEMIQVLWQGNRVELAVELALDALMLREE